MAWWFREHRDNIDCRHIGHLTHSECKRWNWDEEATTNDKYILNLPCTCHGGGRRRTLPLLLRPCLQECSESASEHRRQGLYGSNRTLCIDAIDTDMNARAGDADPGSGLCTTVFLRAIRGAVMLVVCYRKRHGLFAAYQGDSWGAAVTSGAADSSTPVGVSSPSLLGSSASGSITCASGLLSVASASASGA